MPFFNLKPPPASCASTFCSWREEDIYRFCDLRDTDAMVSAFDGSSHLYGTTESGGVYGYGSVYQVSRLNGVWTGTIVHNFTGGNDGAYPGDVLVGSNGNLYGTAIGGAYGVGVVFELSRSAAGWTEKVLHNFEGANDGGYPRYLVQDGAGNLYGLVTRDYDGAIFVLQKTGQSWLLNEYVVYPLYGTGSTLQNLTIDSLGNLYGTGQGVPTCLGQQCLSGASPTSRYGFVFKASYDSNGWHYQDLVDLVGEGFPTSGPLALDSQGNLYGTTYPCGMYGHGTAWRLSP